MKRLTLLRHAKSSWDDDELTDHERPLAKRGLRDAPLMGARLKAHGISPDLLLTSSAARARATTDLIAAGLGEPQRKIRIEPKLYLASPGELLAVIAGLDETVSELILVGHNPGLTQLANVLLPELRLDNLPTAGAVAIDCETASWSAIDAGAFRLRCYDYPKNTEPVSASVQ